MNTGEFELQTDEQHLRALRNDLINARNLVYALDEGRTVDRHFECRIYDDGMHPRVRTLLDSMDSAIAETAYMLDELDI